MLLAPVRARRAIAANQVKKMEPKIYLLLALFSIIVAGASHQNLREYVRKLRLPLSKKDGLQNHA